MWLVLRIWDSENGELSVEQPGTDGEEKEHFTGSIDSINEQEVSIHASFIKTKFLYLIRLN